MGFDTVIGHGDCHLNANPSWDNSLDNQICELLRNSRAPLRKRLNYAGIIRWGHGKHINNIAEIYCD